MRSTALILVLTIHLQAQQWSGIINTTRAVNWQRANVGVSGGIPTNYTQCGSTIAAYTGSASTINSALAACGSNQYVLLGAGTFTITGPITPSTTGTPKSNLILRGSGPTSTILNISSGVSCGNARAAAICVINGNGYFGAGDNSAAVTPPCGGAGASNCFNVDSTSLAQGTTTVIISHVGSSGISNGDEIILDQGNETSDTGGFLTCDTLSPTVCHQNTETGSGNGRVISGLEYSQQQYVTVASGCSSPCTGNGPFTITINQPIYANNWDGHVPMAGWFVKPVTHVGIENLTIDGNSSTSQYNISFYNCRECWVKNVRSLNGQRAHINYFQSSRGEVRDSYIFSTKSGGSQSYGIEVGEGGGSDHLWENNIFQQVTGPIVYGGATGDVTGYNFSIDNVVTPSSYLQFTSSSHDTADTFNLFEGNQLNGFSCDDIHGTANTLTYFRNRLNGRDYNTAGGANNQPTQQTFPIEMNSFCRGFNIIGNVLGTPSYHTNYEFHAGQTPTSAQCNVVIYELGFGGGICSTLSAAGVADDTVVASSLMRWGNYDVVNAAVRWDNTESSPGAVTYISAQTTPASHTLPASFYLSSKPSFFNVNSGSAPYPGIGPDVTGGSGPGGFSYNNPAANCYYTILSGPTDGGGSALAFDANNCYTGAASSGGSSHLGPQSVKGPRTRKE